MVDADAAVGDDVVGSAIGVAGTRCLRIVTTPGTIPGQIQLVAFDSVQEIKVSRSGSIDVVEALGELDMSNVDLLNQALRAALSDETTSCVLDVSELEFLDSSVIKALVRWSNDAQLSDREALAIVVTRESRAARLLDLVGLAGRLPIFATRQAAMTALLEGQRARDRRQLEWLTDAELRTARTDAQTASDDASRRLDDIAAEEGRRSDQSDP